MLYGLDKELQEKADSKYDFSRENDAKVYLEQVLGDDSLFPSESTFQESLKDGVILCELINKFLPKEQQIKKIKKSKMPFMQMENISMFLEKMAFLGVSSHERFMTVDLYENKNMNQVIDSIFALSRTVQKLNLGFPLLGPKLNEKNERTFTESQLNESKSMIPLLNGFTGGASQKGYAIGGNRQVYNPIVGTGDIHSGATKLQGGLQIENKALHGPLGVSFGKSREIGGVYVDKCKEQEDLETEHERKDSVNDIFDHYNC